MSNWMFLLMLCLILCIHVPNVLGEAIFFELFGYKSECVFDHYDDNEVLSFFYLVRADQDDEQQRSEIEIKIMSEDGDLLSTRRGFQEYVHYEVPSKGVYKICFQMVGSYAYERTVIGIEMLGLKSETHYHQKDLVKQEHINPMYEKVIFIGADLDELEALQSASKNWAIQYWSALMNSHENIAFYGWLQGWVLFMVSICQIRMIRQWFAKAVTRLQTKKGSINFRV